MLDNVQFTGTINLGAISTAVLTLLALGAVYLRSKIQEEKTRRLIRDENERTRQCVHQLPGHPEGRKPGTRSRKSDHISPANVSRETGQDGQVNPPLD